MLYQTEVARAKQDTAKRELNFIDFYKVHIPGKDSLTLLCAMSGLQRFYPKHFTIEAITVSLGFDGFKTDSIKEFCENLNVNYTVVQTEIAPIIFNIRKESNPCSLCAKMRKGAFNEKVKELGCNKSAYAHHKDDVIETALMSLLYEGRYHTFSPVTYLDRTDITLIRPMIYVEENDVIAFKNSMNLPVEKNPCPVDGYTKREYVKKLIQLLDLENPGVKERLFHSITEGLLPAWKK